MNKILRAIKGVFGIEHGMYSYVSSLRMAVIVLIGVTVLWESPTRLVPFLVGTLLTSVVDPGGTGASSCCVMLVL